MYGNQCWFQEADSIDEFKASDNEDFYDCQGVTVETIIEDLYEKLLES